MKPKLIEIFGDENVSDSESDLLCSATDATALEGKASYVVWPRNEEQIHKLIKFAARKGFTITTRGAGTGLAGACIADDSVVVDMSRMNKILEVKLKNKEAICQPGVTVKDLNDELDKYDLFFPVIPSSYTVCHLGGLAATNAAGLKALRYGRAQDWIKGLEMIDGTGKLIRLKDPSEIIGTEGILGIITKLYLKLTDPPGQESLTVFKTSFVDEVIQLLDKYKDDPSVGTIELIDKTAAEIAGLEPYNHVIVEFFGDAGRIKEPEEIDEVMSMRSGLGPNLTAKGYQVMEDPKVPVEKVSVFLRWLINNKVPSFGHIGIGVFHPRFKKAQGQLIKEMFAEVQKLGGTASGEHGIGRTKKIYLDPVRKDALSALKKKYDPEDILNRGTVL